MPFRCVFPLGGAPRPLLLCFSFSFAIMLGQARPPRGLDSLRAGVPNAYIIYNNNIYNLYMSRALCGQMALVRVFGSERHTYKVHGCLKPMPPERPSLPSKVDVLTPGLDFASDQFFLRKRLRIMSFSRDFLGSHGPEDHRSWSPWLGHGLAVASWPRGHGRRDPSTGELCEETARCPSTPQEVPAA